LKGLCGDMVATWEMKTTECGADSLDHIEDRDPFMADHNEVVRRKLKTQN
jgi:hypothetical protein